MQHWPLRWGFLEGFGEEGALRGKCFERGRLVCAPTMYEGGQWEGKLNLLPTFIRLWRRGDEKMKRKTSLQTKFHGKNFIYQYAVVSKLVERYFHCSWCQQVMLRSCRKKKWTAKWNKKQKTKTRQLWFKQRETNATGSAYTCTLKNNTVALNNSRNQPTVRLMPWATNILVLNWEGSDDKGEGRREGKRRREHL